MKASEARQALNDYIKTTQAELGKARAERDKARQDLLDEQREHERTKRELAHARQAEPKE